MVTVGYNPSNATALMGPGGLLCIGCCGENEGFPCTYCSGMTTALTLEVSLGTPSPTQNFCSWCIIASTGSPLKYYGTWQRLLLSGYTGSLILQQQSSPFTCTWFKQITGNFGTVIRNYVAYADRVDTYDDCTVGIPTTKYFDTLSVQVDVISATQIRVNVNYRNDWFSISMSYIWTVDSGRLICVPDLSGGILSNTWASPLCASGDQTFTQAVSVNS